MPDRHECNIPGPQERPELSIWMEDRFNPNKLSFWFPLVMDCGIRVPTTFIIPVPESVCRSFIHEREGDGERIRAFVEKQVMPVVNAIPGLPFIKNGCFSDKFQFQLCCPPSKDLDTIVRSISGIMYDSLCFDTAGYTEIVIRERIPSPETMPTIYGGMPLNTEFRIFYNFTEHRLLYAANYWDWDECHDAMCRHEPDKKAYEARYPELLKEYKENVQMVCERCSKALENIGGMAGIWSVDILMDGNGELWLIDMAVGRMSVYYDPEKCK